jgi:hypothetical protein
MIALVVAMIVLQNTDPTPVVTPAASIGQRLTGSSPASSLQGLDTTSPFGDTTIAVGCTYGAPRLGPSLFSDANELARSATMANCTDPAGQSFSSPLAYSGPAFVTLGRPGFAPTALSTVGEPNAPTTFSMNPRPGRSFAIQHLVVPTELRGSAGSPTTAQFHATTTATHAPTGTSTVHRSVPVTHNL